jgi:hypothetical protein
MLQVLAVDGAIASRVSLSDRGRRLVKAALPGDEIESVHIQIAVEVCIRQTL